MCEASEGLLTEQLGINFAWEGGVVVGTGGGMALETGPEIGSWVGLGSCLSPASSALAEEDI